MVIGSLILKLGVEGSNLDALRNFETNTKRAAQTTTTAVVATQKLDKTKTTLIKTLQSGLGVLKTFRTQIMLLIVAETALSRIGGLLAQSLHVFTNNTGMSSQALQEWQQKAALVGISAEEVSKSMSGLQQSVIDVMMGGGDSTPFARLGVSLTRDANVMMKQLSAAAQTMAPDMFTKFASQLGVSPEMISFFRDLKDLEGGDKELILSKEELARLRDFNIYFNRVWDNVKRTANKVGAIFAPIAREVMNILDKMAKFGLGVVKMFDGLGNLDKYRIPILALAAALGLIFAPKTTLLLAALAILQDFYALSQGKLSVTGGILGYLSDVNRVTQDIVLWILTLSDLLERSARFWTGQKPPDTTWAERQMDKNTGMFKIYNDAKELMNNKDPKNGPLGLHTYDSETAKKMAAASASASASGTTINNDNSINVAGSIGDDNLKKVQEGQQKQSKTAIVNRPIKEGDNK